jgi:mRNA interferase MazF
MVLVSPLTTFRGQPWQAASPKLYPVLASGTAGIAVDSVVLLDQTQATDVFRITSLVGVLTPQEYQPIESALRQVCSV